MATTRIMPLHVGKGRTESRAISDIIDYVANPQKTDNGRLITGYACDSRTADAEFLLAKRQYKGDIPGSLFMAAQTYVWDHQTFKGEGDGDIDGGGYANADTYEMYLGYIDWMLKEKAKEDAEFQRQIEEYAEQGIIATVVEDEAAKWAVYAKSSVKVKFLSAYM